MKHPQYTHPSVTIGSFDGTTVIDIRAGRRSIVVKPEDAEAVVKGMAIALAWLNEHPALQGDE